MNKKTKPLMAKRFRSYLPVVVDVETAGFNPQTDALLEIAAVIINMDDEGFIHTEESFSYHIQPFPGANLNPDALKFTGIDLNNPFRLSLSLSEGDALHNIFNPIRKAVKDAGCTRAILVGHNPCFDLSFLNAAVARTQIKRNPFHPFSSFDTATLGGLAFGQTVLAKAAEAAGLSWDDRSAHSAAYDADRTAELFCVIINHWERLTRDATTKSPSPAINSLFPSLPTN